MSIRVMTAVWASAPFTHTTLLVLLALADSANDAGVCWPSVPGLAERARTSTRHVRRALADIEQAGWVKREMRPGRKTLYRITPDTQVTPDEMSPRTQGSPTPDTQVTPPRTPTSATPDTHVLRTVRNHQKNRQGNRQELAATPDRFDEFWSIYPRKVSKPDARRAWAAALKRTDADTVIDGARRYADDPNRDPSYTKHPGTWLRNECWNDDPLPARGGTRPLDRQAELLRQEMARARAADQAAAGEWNQIGA